MVISEVSKNSEISPTLQRKNLPNQSINLSINQSIRDPLTLKPIAERLEVDQSIPVFMTWVCRGWD